MNASLIDGLDKAHENYGDSALTLAATAQVAAVLVALQAIVAFVQMRRRGGFLHAVRMLRRVDNDDSEVDRLEQRRPEVAFIRLLKTHVHLFAGLSIFVVPALLPVNRLQPRGQERAKGLDRYSYMNIPPERHHLFWIHLIMLILSVLWCSFIIYTGLEAFSELEVRPTIGMRSRFIVYGSHSDMARDELLNIVKKMCPESVLSKPVVLDKLALIDPSRMSALLSAIEKVVLRSRWKTDLNHSERRIEQIFKKINVMTNRLQDAEVELPLAILDVCNPRDLNIIRSLHIPGARISETGLDLNDIQWHRFPTRKRSRHNKRYISLRQKHDSLLIQCLTAVTSAVLALPVSFQGIVAYLYEFVRAINPTAGRPLQLPTWLGSYLGGVFPQVLALCFVLCSPLVIRALVRRHDLATSSDLDATFSRYLFAYLFLQVFVFVSLSTSITAALSVVVQRPNELPELLSTNLPKAGNYFISYVLVQGLTLAVGSLVDRNGLLEYLLWKRLGTRTARQTLLDRCPSECDWAVLFPSVTLMGVIGLAYSIITPIILPCILVVVLAVLCTFAYRSSYTQTHYKSYALFLGKTALLNLYWGLYTLQLCMLGTFLSLRDQVGQRTCTAQAVITLVGLLATIASHRVCHTRANRVKVIVPSEGTSIPCEDPPCGFATPPALCGVRIDSTSPEVYPRGGRHYALDDIAPFVKRAHIYDDRCHVAALGTIHVPKCDNGTARHITELHTLLMSHLHGDDSTLALSEHIRVAMDGYILDEKGTQHVNEDEVLQRLRLDYYSHTNRI